jgi:hypothetical protein
MGIQEVFAGTTVTDTHLDFSDSSKYSLQNSGKILIGNNKAQLNIFTKLLMHFDDNTFKDECGHIATASNVTIDNSTKVFGTGSCKFNGVGNSKIIFPSSDDWNLNGTDWTIDFRMNITQYAGAYGFIISRVTGGARSFGIDVDNNGNTI